MLVLLDQGVGQRRVEQAVDVQVLLDEVVVAFVVLSSAWMSARASYVWVEVDVQWLLHLLQLLVRLVVLFPGAQSAHARLIHCCKTARPHHLYLGLELPISL